MAAAPPITDLGEAKVTAESRQSLTASPSLDGQMATAQPEAYHGGPSAAVKDALRVSWVADAVVTRPDDIVLWRRLAVADWITEAALHDLYAEDVTYEVLEWRRDSDDVACRGSVQVCVDSRYDA